MDVTQRGALRDSTKQLRGDTSKSLANVSDDGQLIFYRIRSKLLFPLKKIDKLMFSIRRLYANMSSAYASDTFRSLSKEPQKACAVKRNRIGAYDGCVNPLSIPRGIFHSGKSGYLISFLFHRVNITS